MHPSSRTSPALAPAITVVIAVYNDVDHIRAAVDSVLNQTMDSVEVIVVDDGSTDGTVDLLERSYASNGKVKTLRMPSNSGAAGAPRNMGMDHARGQYLMFLDSDDVLERHACINMYRVAVKTGAGLVMGQTKREHIGADRMAGWHTRLYTERRSVGSIEDEADLAIDTNSVAKLYPRAWLDAHEVRFPEDIHYEDLVFTAQVFALAENIEVIPEVVYYWRIYPSDERESITHQRSTTRSIDFRVEALRRIIAGIDPARNPNLRSRLQLKILRHDARVYLNDIADGASDEFSLELLARLAPLIQDVPLEIFDDIDLAERLALAAALAQQPALVREAISVVKGKVDLPGTVQIEDGITLWRPEVFGELEVGHRARQLATFSEEEIGSITWFGMKFEHRLQSMKRVKGGGLRLAGTTADQLGHLEGVPGLQWQARLYEREGLQRDWVFPVEVIRSEDGLGWSWSTVVSLPGAVDFTVLPRMTLRMDLQAGAVRSSAGITVTKKHKWATYRRSSAGAVSRLFGARYQPYKTVQNTLALKPSPVQGQRNRLRVALRPLWAAARRLEAQKWVPIPERDALHVKFAYWLMRRLPLHKHIVLVDSHMGTSTSDSPHAIAHALREQFPNVTVVRAASAGRPVWAAGQDDVVRIGTWKHLSLLARAGGIVDNQSLPWYFIKRRGQVYVQTWHGIPLKRMGLDQAEVAGDKSRVADLKQRSGYWDYLSIPSEFFREVFVPAFAYAHAELPVGSPRNDELVLSNADTTRAAKAQLGLDPQRQTVLYAPTFRDGQRGPVALELDLDEWVAEMATDFQLLVRPHYLNRINVPRHLRRHVVDVSSIKDTNLVMLAADLLVTDYSSVMFDYLVLDRPQVLYTYDLERYSGSLRGTYFDLREDAPGPLAMDQEQLMDEVRRGLQRDTTGAQRAEFRGKFAGDEPGDVSRATVQAVWGE